MKTKKLNKKLNLKKSTIAALNNFHMVMVKGGENLPCEWSDSCTTEGQFSCECQTELFRTECRCASVKICD